MRPGTSDGVVAKRLKCARSSLLITLVVLLSACSAPSIALPGRSHQPQPIPTAASPRAETYLLTAFDFVRHHYYYASQIDWRALKRKVFQRAENARTPSETYPAINYFLLSLPPSTHTFFLTPEEARRRFTPYETSYPNANPLPDGLGYLDIPSFASPSTGGPGSQAQSYAIAAQSAIRSLAASSPCGWVVDLRGNTGGYVLPMLAAVGPILGDGPAGSFVTATGDRIPWTYRDGSATLGSATLQVPNAYQLPLTDAPVAVLTDPRTTSAGEATLISFLGRPNTMTFGQPTFGAPSAPDAKFLSDDAYISVVAELDADRTGHLYQDNVPIPPEQAVPRSRAASNDPTLGAAEAWLAAQPACTR